MASDRLSAQLHPLRSQMTVITDCPADAVRAAGGWLCDRALAGWDVAVLTVRPGDHRPLQILGARAYDDPGAALPSPDFPEPQVPAVSAPARLDDRDGKLTRQARFVVTGAGPTEVWLLDGNGAGATRSGMAVVRHQLSVAARAFKAQALLAAGLREETVAPIEVFHAWAGRPGNQLTAPASRLVTTARSAGTTGRPRRQQDPARELIHLLHNGAN